MSATNNEDLREIYGLLREIKEDLAAMKASTGIDHRRLDQCESKIDRVESVLDRMTGAKGVMAFLLSALGAFLLFVFQCVYNAFHWGSN